ncbi:hypothetical protein SAMN04488127_0627 [Bhargavaea ginsengi]|uniref:Glycine zipper-like domain-containing protein n=1 Tax=Bhargavaea ginsengi TaxID=426757 RepID=A0A1H6U283_9BACL|nr:hypothetical protein [Bhargavaea ginsengi]SEI85596.1 hypothetical protein SAMN04488127_0627 [Bhargavaea ginsengi]
MGEKLRSTFNGSGIAIGSVYAVVFGMLFENIAMGISLGLVFSIIFSGVFDEDKRKERNQCGS